MKRTKEDEIEREKSDDVIDVIRNGKKIVDRGKIVKEETNEK